MSKTSGRPWSGWQTKTESRTRTPRVGDTILTRVDGTVCEGIIKRLLEEFDGRHVVAVEVTWPVPGSTVTRRLIEAIDEPLEAMWSFKSDPQPEGASDVEVEARIETQDQTAAAQPAARTGGTSGPPPCIPEPAEAVARRVMRRAV